MSVIEKAARCLNVRSCELSQSKKDKTIKKPSRDEIFSAILDGLEQVGRELFEQRLILDKLARKHDIQLPVEFPKP